MNRKNQGWMFWCMLVSAFLSAAVYTVTVQGGSLEEPDRLIDDGTYKVVLAASPDVVWDIADADTQDGANLRLYEDLNTDAQRFVFTYLSDGYYFITNANSSKAVGCGPDMESVQQSAFINSDEQLWKLIRTENECYRLVCKANGLAADAEGGAAESGKNIGFYQSDQTAAQEFRLINTYGRADGQVPGSSSVGEKHSKVFFYAVAFVILAVMAVAVIGIGYYTDSKRGKK